MDKRSWNEKVEAIDRFTIELYREYDGVSENARAILSASDIKIRLFDEFFNTGRNLRMYLLWTLRTRRGG
ncbi:MAG: hypothetical protein LBU32_33270 [Clostridiales bacterium]|nr:hypothetical protein [Clostridiales bacterium]